MYPSRCNRKAGRFHNRSVSFYSRHGHRLSDHWENSDGDYDRLWAILYPCGTFVTLDVTEREMFDDRHAESNRYYALQCKLNSIADAYHRQVRDIAARILLDHFHFRCVNNLRPTDRGRWGNLYGAKASVGDNFDEVVRLISML